MSACGGQEQNHLREISSGFRTSKVDEIGWFLTELFLEKYKVGVFLGNTAYT